MIITLVGDDFFPCKDEGDKDCGNYYEYPERNLYVFWLSVMSDIAYPLMFYLETHFDAKYIYIIYYNNKLIHIISFTILLIYDVVQR